MAREKTSRRAGMAPWGVAPRGLNDVKPERDNVVEQMMTVAEVATLLRVSPDRVRRWIRDGKLRAIRYDGRGQFAVFASSVSAWIGRHVSAPAARKRTRREREVLSRRDQAARRRMGYV